jgi:hypothetical protein
MNRRAPTPCASSSSGKRSLMPLPIQIIDGREPAVTSTRTPALVRDALDIQQ